MLNSDTHREKWRQVSAMVAQYPAIDLTRQYKYLIAKRFIAANIFTLLLQYIGLMISTLLAVPSPVWIASGTACAMVFLRGDRIAAGIWLGSLIAYYSSGCPLLLSCCCATLFVAQAVLLEKITRRYIYPTLVFHRASDLLKFFIVSGILTSVFSMMLVEFSQQSYTLWPTWWLANLNGVFIVSIALVSADTFFASNSKLTKGQWYWSKIAKSAFILVLFLDMLFYLNLSVVSMSLFSIFALQISLLIGVLGSLFVALRTITTHKYD